MTERRRRAVTVSLVALGIGLALAPAAFGMFGRAPGGGRMLQEFAPYMTESRLDAFRQHLAVVDNAHGEVVTEPNPPPALAQFTAGWPAIERDMSSMLDTISANLGRYRGLAALPPFWLFPWFFVVPGLLLAAGGVALRRAHQPRVKRILRMSVLGVGLGLVAAPLVLQMFVRAPGGAAMIDDFRALMTDERVGRAQSSFLTIGAGEAALRNQVVPRRLAESRPAPHTQALLETWPQMAADMAPMIGAMADNLDRFAGIAALPPFWLFPWFFVLPGVLTASAVLALGRTAEPKRLVGVATLTGSATP